MNPQITSKPIIRAALIEDFDAVYPLLQELNSTRLGREEWSRLFSNHWQLDNFSPGMVLQADNKIVGYLGTIYSEQLIQGQYHLCCNLSSWIVKEAYRSHSIMMLLPLIRKKNLLLTSFSSNNVTYELYKKLGFKDGCSGRRLVYPWPSSRAGQYQLLTDKDKIRQYLSSEEQRIVNEHSEFGNVIILITHQQDSCLIWAVKRKKYLKIYYVNNCEFLKQHLQFFRSKLIRFCGVKKLLIDECLLGGKRLFLTFKKHSGNSYQYKTTIKNCPAPVPLYSELFMLNM